MVERRDREHPERVQTGGNDERRRAYAHPPNGDASEMDGEEGQKPHCVDAVVASIDRQDGMC